MNPLARREGLVVRELSGETLVYDTTLHLAHCLNRPAAEAFRHADGTRTVTELARLVAPGASPRAGAAATRLALDGLSEAGLLVRGEPASGPSRREALKQVARAAAVLVPAVASVLAPAPAEAAATCVSSCVGRADNTPCSCSGAPVCTAVCIAETCSDGGGC